LLVRGDSCKQQEKNIKLLRSTIKPDENTERNEIHRHKVVEKETKTLQTADAARFRYLWAQITAIKQERKKKRRNKGIAGNVPSLSWILVFTLSMVSLLSTSSVIVFPVRVFTKICILEIPEKRFRSSNSKQGKQHQKVR
jgi:hypothetical protein